jgi:hypothetical protein
MIVPRRKLLFPLIVIALAVVSALGLGLWVNSARRNTSASRPLAGGLECGQWAVVRTCEVLGVPVSPRAVRDMMPAGTRGNSLKEIADVLQRAGLVAQGKREAFETFLAHDGIRVVHIAAPEHFIVVVRSGPEHVFYFDYRGRRQAMLSSDLRQRWSGNVLYVDRPPLTTPVGFVGRDASDGQSRVQFETLFIDKGDIATTAGPQTVQFVYPFQNVGKSDLLIKKVYTDCACLVAKKPEHTVPPGGTNTVTLQYSVDNRKSSFLHEAVVETNDPVYPAIALRAAGNTNTLVAVSPSALDLGSIPSGENRRTYLFLRYAGEEEFEIRGAESTVPFLSLAVHDTVTGEALDQVWPRSHGTVQLGKGCRILEVTASPSSESLGDVKGQITIATNIGRFEKITVPVKGRVVNPVAAVPSLLSFGEVNPAEALERSLALVSLVNKPFRVVALTPKPAGLEWKVAQTADNGSRAQMCFSTTGAVAQTLSGSTLNVTVESDGKQFDVGIPVFAGKKPRP